MLMNLQKRMVFVEIKFSLIQIAHDLLADEVYTREEAVQALLKVIYILERQEQELSRIEVML
ncbi:hypothetical protein [Bacillus horti]